MKPTPDQFDDVDWDNPDAVIAFCEAHRDWLAEIPDEDAPPDAIIDRIDAITYYAFALSLKGEFDAALDNALYADDLADFLDEDTAVQEGTWEDTEYSLGAIRAQRGEFLRAWRLFRRLSGPDPIHSDVHLWLRYCRLRACNKMCRFAGEAGMVLIIVMLSITFGGLPGGGLLQYLFPASTGLLLTGLLGEWSTRKKLQRMHSEHNA